MTTSLLQPPLRLDEYRASAPPMSTGLHQRAHSFAGHAHRLLSPPPQTVTARPSFTHFLPPPQNQSSITQRQPSLQLPGLAALASIASDQVQPSPHLTFSRSSSMSYATAAPGQSPGGVLPAGPPICQNCQTSTTPLWRRDESGSVLCNACGLFLKLHGRARPISLKTDVIKSRNRVKAVGPNGQKKRTSNVPAQGLAAAHPDIASVPQAAQAHRRASQQHEPLSRAGTPSQYPPHPTNANIAPQHLFDNSTLDPQINPPYSQSPILNNRPQSPSSLANGGSYDPSSQQLPSYDFLVSQNNRLKTRVSELEVINDLFQGRVSELEAALSQLQGTAAASEEVPSTSTPTESKKREADDGAATDDHRSTAAAAVAAAAATAYTTKTTETGSNGGDGSGTVRRSKRMRMSDLLDEDAREATPASTGTSAGAPTASGQPDKPAALAVGLESSE